MMLNYLKGEAYRIAHGRAAYLFAGTLCAIVLAANVLLWAMSSTPGFPYATVRFSMSNLVSMLPLLFYMAGLLVWVLFADDRKDGTLKNAIAHGCSRRDLFLGKCLVATVLGLAILAVVLAVYVGSAVLLLEGSTEAVAIPVSYTHLDVYKRQDLEEAVDELRRRFGNTCIQRGTELLDESLLELRCV